MNAYEKAEARIGAEKRLEQAAVMTEAIAKEYECSVHITATYFGGGDSAVFVTVIRGDDTKRRDLNDMGDLFDILREEKSNECV